MKAAPENTPQKRKFRERARVILHADETLLQVQDTLDHQTEVLEHLAEILERLDRVVSRLEVMTMPLEAMSAPMVRARMRRAAKREAAEQAETHDELAEVFEALTAG
ncbi:MAG TPA: hypothetical protein VLI04_20210 [Nocardioidaceae bacterium]|nr:hypothetical protein [Nocardioidaceae bacterium]